jgi:hypothetical protein
MKQAPESKACASWQIFSYSLLSSLFFCTHLFPWYVDSSVLFVL